MVHMKNPVAPRRQHRQRGSALLIVLVFAAIVAIMLYREMPIAAFEAQRQKEELLISRGNEYKRGVKLFVRKIGRFPSSIEEMENTNRMRFLRHRYVDPLTGKDDWRIIHAGPGGVIVDSKVQDASTQGKGANALGQGAVFAGFNNSFSGDASAVAEAGPPSVALRQRPAATKNASSGGQDGLGLPTGGGETASNDVNPEASGQPVRVFNPQPPFDPNTGQAYTGTPPSVNSNQPNGGQATLSGPNGFAATNGPDPNVGAGNGIGTVAQQLNNVNPKTPETGQTGQTQPGQQQPAFGINPSMGFMTNTGTGAGNGQIGAAGGIAGVASKALGKSIKTVNDQTKYSLWEFYFDLRKEQQAGGTAGRGGGL